MIHTLHSLFETNALDFTKAFAIHAFDAFIPNHVLRCITIINGCYQYSCKVNKKNFVYLKDFTEYCHS